MGIFSWAAILEAQEASVAVLRRARGVGTSLLPSTLPQEHTCGPRPVGGSYDDVITSMALDLAQSNVLVTGQFQGSVNFTIATLASADNEKDTFLAKYSTSNGTPVWVKNFPNRGYDRGTGVFVDNSDNVLLAGYFGTRIDLGGGILYSAGTSGYADIYIAKFAPSRTAPTTPLWSKRYGGTGGETLCAAGLDASGNLVLGGHSLHRRIWAVVRLLALGLPVICSWRSIPGLTVATSGAGPCFAPKAEDYAPYSSTARTTRWCVATFTGHAISAPRPGPVLVRGMCLSLSIPVSMGQPTGRSDSEVQVGMIASGSLSIKPTIPW